MLPEIAAILQQSLGDKRVLWICDLGDSCGVDRKRRLAPTFCMIVYLHAWETGLQAKAEAGRWITFYNHKWLHSAHGGRPPAVVYFNSIQANQQVQAAA